MSSTSSLWHAARNPPADPTKSPSITYKDKAVLVTGAFGANSLGHNAAIKYAALGANPLILAVRTAEKGEQAKQSIIRATNCSPDIFIIETVDFASFASVKALADRVTARVPALHVLQLAAGVAPFTYASSADGYEMALQVDVLSTVLLALLLLPKMRETAAAAAGDESVPPPHISFLLSVAIFMIPENDVEMVPPLEGGQSLIQRLNDQSKWNFVHHYFLIKLATWYAIKGVVELVDSQDPGVGSRVVVNASCPGLCKTGMAKEMPFVYRVFMLVRWFVLGRTAEMGARTLVSATALGAESHGRLWTNDRFHEMTPFLESERSAELYRETWDEVLSILRTHVPGLQI